MIDLDVRILATSNRRLREEVAAGRFREDLFYRLNVFPLTIPALKDRTRDIIPLAKHMIQRHLKVGDSMPEFNQEAEQKMLSHTWPGNVRELDNVVQRALILHSGNEIAVQDLCFENDEVLAVDLSERPTETTKVVIENEASDTSDKPSSGTLSNDLKSVEEKMILDALSSGNGSRKVAAEILGISPRTLRYKIARLRDAGVALPR